MNAVIYARFSSDKQNEASITAQVRACEEYAQKHDIHILRVYADEAISGKGSKTAQRTQYQKMLRDCRAGEFDTVLIHKYDRIARNLGEHVMLESKLTALGISLVAVAQDFGGGKEAKIVKALLWSMSEFYIDNLSDEVKKGHKETAIKGLHNGGYPPFGYDVVDQKYVVNELEAGYVKKMFDCAIDRVGFSSLIREMESCGIKGKRGKFIRYSQIYEILKNEKYTGVYIYSPQEEQRRGDRREKPNGIRIDGVIPQIIDKETFAEVQKVMEKRKQTGCKGSYLCSGLVYCSCGAKMHVQASKRKGHAYEYYTCSKKCGVGTVPVHLVDEAARAYLKELLSKKTQEDIMLAMKRYTAKEKGDITLFNREIQKQINEKQSQYDAYMERLGQELPPAVVKDIGEKMEALKEEISALKTVEPPKDYTVPDMREWLNKLKTAPDFEGVRLLIERIDVKKDKENPPIKFNIESTLDFIGGNIGECE